jgi:hypothetical protein
MQLQLPIFPQDTKLINPILGVYERAGIVQYLLNGMPMYSHAKDDIQAFRFITSNCIHLGLCRKVDIQRAFGVSDDSVGRAYKRYRHAHIITGEVRIRIQAKLDQGQSNNSIAKEEGIRESAIRYALQEGYLKKKAPLA